ncbi:hypothetical protein OG230_35895 [Streptomyces sp. NBC_00234]|uniref:hypothetical protein n=1 Tax=Streptomyces sp. NBC_00234 TaxID=2903638 RepID=UPI002E2B298D|nr:hypothetical protein [Streptomyces sp. NBC_00234]
MERATRPARRDAGTPANGTVGAKLHPYADLQPAGTRSDDFTRLGHTSPGSPDF